MGPLHHSAQGNILAPGKCSDGGVYMMAGEYVLGDPEAEPGEAGYGLFGGTNGFSYTMRWWDVAFVGGFAILMRVLDIWATSRISYESR